MWVIYKKKIYTPSTLRYANWMYRVYHQLSVLKIEHTLDLYSARSLCTRLPHWVRSL
jgi:hypothetical protein